MISTARMFSVIAAICGIAAASLNCGQLCAAASDGSLLIAHGPTSDKKHTGSAVVADAGGKKGLVARNQK